MTAQSQPENVRLGEDGESVVLLDQTRLPGRVEYRTVRDLKEMVEAIRTLRVRGAPAIGVFAGFCLSALARQMERAGLDTPGLLRELDRKGKILVSSRPTAVNLSWAVERMMDRASGLAGGAPEAAAALEAESRAIRREDEEMCRAIAEHGLSLLKAGDGVLTHCNAGPLATSRYGTALGPILLAGERGIPLRVFADETRPLLQGARLTAWELARAGVEVTLICDNMASMVMKNGWIQAVLVGCDRVAMNGDAANKIGTSGVAILAKHYGIPFYVLGPTSTVDPHCATGADIQIEERPGDEIKELYFERPTALPQTKCYNPAFDVTDHDLITAIITDKGILRPPYTESLRALFQEEV